MCSSDLDEIKNDITKTTPASFEPTIDYIVTKIPRFTFEKFNDSNQTLSSTMRSVGEAMAIGRNFAESIQKGLSSMEIGLSGFDEISIEDIDENLSLDQKQNLIKKSLEILSPTRILKIAQALRYEITTEEICQITQYDPWFVRQIKNIIDCEKKIIANGLPNNKTDILNLKKLGFSDERLAKLSKKSAAEIYQLRQKFNINPVFKRVDTCSAEFESFTNYMYSCYEGDSINKAECEANISNQEKIIILGGGPNRIGQGIEFDYACVHAAFALKEAGFETIMINCNPETVSTDYDTSDRLYFEPMTTEHVLNIARKEQENGHLKGVIVQFGGQTALKLARDLNQANIPIIGTPFDKIDLAEDRERFQGLLNDIGLTQPENSICHKLSEVEGLINNIGYPVVLRPSNVLGGRAMEIIYDKKSLDKYISINGKLILDGPILVDKFLDNAIEIDVDALCDGSEVKIVGIMEHIEEAGIHSGDSACSLPPYSLTQQQIENVKDATIKLALNLGVIGLMNVQYAFKDNKLYVIEVNPRASRTVPFVAKATGIDVAKIASLIMAGKSLDDFDFNDINYSNEYYSVKEVVFPFARFANTDILLSPEMKSTGEVMGIDKDFDMAFIKAQIAANNKVIFDKENLSALISVKNEDKNQNLLNIVKRLQSFGCKIYTTSGTAKFLIQNNLQNINSVNKEDESGYNVINLIKDKKVNLVINTTSDAISIAKSFNMRREILMNQIFYITTIRAANCAVDSIEKLQKINGDFHIVCLQDLSSHSNSSNFYKKDIQTN